MTVRKLLLLVSLFMVLVSAVVGGIVASRTKTGFTHHISYAYYTADEFVLIRGDAILARVPGAFSAQTNRIVWTSTGRHVAFILAAKPNESFNNDTLISVDSYTGSIQRIPCKGCIDIAASDGDAVVTVAIQIPDSIKIPADKTYMRSDVIDSAFDSGHVAVRKLDLGNSGQRVSIPLSTTASDQFLVGTSSAIVTRSYLKTPSGGPRWKLSLLSMTTGKETKLAFGSRTESLLTASNSPGSSEQVVIARQGFTQYGACSEHAEIALLPVADKKLSTTDLSALKPRAATTDDDWGSSVTDVWWGADGHFHASMASWQCSKRRETPTTYYGDEERLLQTEIQPVSLWRLNDSHIWEKEDGPSAAMTRSIEDGYISLIRPSCIGEASEEGRKEEYIDNDYCDRGRLVRTTNGNDRLIAEDVLSLSTEPVRSRSGVRAAQ
ncbi:Uncharacterised protein [Mycobacteroides abscessus subsp. abscessus]|uniref:hypothetical protein n=1 Tax=Mycobacteroides abscessus TaxID=36809 RepID=UPI000926557F|nr:hypothetical protein [Mycobacteroides abscessus]SIF22878.1 Uncharacterised protein [Mycobacteroides abscessus subsp. abscessus]